MKFSNCKIYLFALLVSISAPIYSAAPQEPETAALASQAPSQQEINDFFEELVKKVTASYDRLDSILQDLNLVVNGDKISHVGQSATQESKNAKIKAFIKEMLSTREVVQNFKKESFVQVNPASIVLLSKVADRISGHIIACITALESSSATAADMPTFNLTTEVENITQRGMDLQNIDLEQEFTRLEANINELDNRAQNVDISTFNKIVRYVDNKIVQPASKLKVPRRLGLGLAVSFFAWYFLWFRTDRGTPVATQPASQNGPTQYGAFEEWLRNKVGHYPHRDILNSTVIHHDPQDFHFNGRNPLGLLGNTEQYIKSYADGNYPIGLLGASMVLPFYKNDLIEIKNKITQKMSEWYNRAKGGIYIKKAEETPDHRMHPRFTSDDVIGLDHVNEDLDIILQYFRDPERWDRAGIPPQKGFVFAGPTRTGKSFRAEALAGDIRKILIEQNKDPEKLGFYAINGAAIKQMGGIANILEMARREAPCVLFIDEIDLLALQRTGDKDMLQEMLTALSGFLSDNNGKPVFIITATNKLENIDTAILQPGRLGKIIHFDYPTIKEREFYFAKRLSPHVINVDSLNLHQFALECEGAHFETLNAIVVKALQDAKNNNSMLSIADLDNALDRELRKITVKDNRNLREEERRMHAINQASHALAELLLPTGRKLAKVTINPVQNKLREEAVWDALYKPEGEKQKGVEYGRIFTYHDYDTAGFYTNQELLSICQVELAGNMGELILADANSQLPANLGGSSYHPMDMDRAMQLATKIVLSGMKLDTMSKKMQNQKLDEVYALIQKAQDQVKALLQTHKAALQAITQKLLEQHTLTGKEVQEIIDAHKAAL